MTTTYRCPRCQATVAVRQPLKYPPVCSCGVTDDGKPRLKPVTMKADE